MHEHLLVEVICNHRKKNFIYGFLFGGHESLLQGKTGFHNFDEIYSLV